MAIQGRDLRDVFSEDQMKLEEKLKDVKLDPQTKEIILLVLEFGYAAAHSSRTCDMNQSYHGAQRYDDGYHAMEKMIEKMETK